jgi:nicotinate-nucleotide pyrophosphorylase (carboxylating)
MYFPDTPAVRDYIKAALEEDMGCGDVTTISTIPGGVMARGRYIVKEDGVLCGLRAVELAFSMLDPSITVIRHADDGARVKRGDVAAEVYGRAVPVLTGERVGLNLLQHLSGVATATAKAAAAVAGTKARITDTRKTTPLMRTLEKYAVRCGGGVNHRYNLADGVLIKDNHIVAAGSITAAVKAARAVVPHTLKIEVECENEAMVREALAAGADIIMLDNMDCDAMASAVALIDGRALTEASGNMGERDLAAVAETGVDLISIGALTHSVRALDISLKFTLSE